MPNAVVAARFVDTAAMCADTTAFAVTSPRAVSERTSHALSDRAFSIVSAVVKVLEITMTKVVSGHRGAGRGGAQRTERRWGEAEGRAGAAWVVPRIGAAHFPPSRI